ncbi:LacI family DNA-binding transcriptional regulator [Virgibacillus siamensis]|uniref:LacI family DNA-binding transcriptional regulator n=1 Tax=Virgibacillus siamensis TaxID=480071 RepID=UPI00098625A8|nr:LacI family DNA-binding transcriptional regulator [Virgibacillus siamensis]
MATIRDVAKLAEVSTATVSRVLNKNGYVNKATETRVQEAIKQLNYLPNDVARSLFKGRSRTIALFVPDITNPFFPELARAVEDYSNHHQYNFVLCNTDNDLEKEIVYLNALKQKSVDGFIIVSNSITEDHLQRINAPVVALDRVFSTKVSSVTVNNREGARKAVQHLKSLGCNRIAHIAGPEKISSAGERRQGYLDEVGDEDWFKPEYVVQGKYDFDTAKKAAIQLLTGNPEVDGLFAGNDLMGAGVLNAAASLGISIPDDLAVIGFDGISISKIITPALTTMAQPIYEIGTRAAELLITQISSENPTIKNETLDVQLIERQSTGERAGEYEG